LLSSDQYFLRQKSEHMNKLALYFRLIRADKPIGILLLLWPTLWALWMASGGVPALDVLAIFVIGTALMRSSGCAINDYADRDFDRHVKRTVDRPLTSGKIRGWEAVMVAAVLAIASFLLILPLNALTKQLSVVAVVVAGTYPYFKRFFAIPQAYLGIAFGFGIPMAFAAVQGAVPGVAWWLLVANVFWAVAYDTAYAMVDRDDDIKLGMRTSAITFGRFDVAAIMLCYGASLAIFLLCGWSLGLRWWFVAGVAVAGAIALYHYTLIRHRDRMNCFKAFRHNNWLGAALFIGVALDYALG
jgi:4-hydroxybenzoate polyprenyltransferase